MKFLSAKKKKINKSKQKFVLCKFVVRSFSVVVEDSELYIELRTCDN